MSIHFCNIHLRFISRLSRIKIQNLKLSLIKLFFSDLEMNFIYFIVLDENIESKLMLRLLRNWSPNVRFGSAANQRLSKSSRNCCPNVRFYTAYGNILKPTEIYTYCALQPIFKPNWVKMYWKSCRYTLKKQLGQYLYQFAIAALLTRFKFKLYRSLFVKNLIQMTHGLIERHDLVHWQGKNWITGELTPVDPGYVSTNWVESEKNESVGYMTQRVIFY